MGLLDGIESLKAGEGLVHLSQVTIITEELRKIPIWAALFDDYSKVTEADRQCMVSIFNAALTHQRRVFALTRDGVEKLVRTDPNWVNSPVFNSKKWSSYLLFMYERGMLKKIYERRVSVFELVFPRLLEIIPDSEEHRKQAIDFAEKEAKVRISKSDFSIAGSNRDLFPKIAEKKYKPFVPDPEVSKFIDENFKFDGFTDDDLTPG